MDFEDRILSEYDAGKAGFYALTSSLATSCKEDRFPYAMRLAGFLRNEVRKSGTLPSFFNELELGIRKFILGSESKINTRDCVNCTLKHVSSAAVIINEILNGYENTDHEIFLMGNLNEACEQISETSIKLSNELRNIRVDIFEKEKKVTQLHLKKVKEIYRKVRAFTDVKIGKEILEKLPVKIKTAEKPCGCRGK
jgi:hypothetical protein